MQITRTDSSDHRFIGLVKMLDQDLAQRDGDEHAFYSQFNQMETLKHAVVGIENGHPAACGAFRPFDENAVEVKRMYTLPEKRGKGLAAAILNELERWASEEGYGRVVLETGKRQPEAVSFYQKHGYQLIENFGPYAGVGNSLCFEKLLSQ